MELPLKIGIAGTGRMGAAVAGRLLSVGHDVSVWNRTRGRTEALALAGASVAATPAELATRAEIVITFLTDAAAIDATYHGSDGLLAGEVRGKLFIDMSTVRPETEKALAAKVGAKAAALIECPVGGTRGPAIAAALQGKETTPVTFDVDLIRKDLRTMLEEAKALGVTLPVSSRALECYDDVAREGFGASDATMLPAQWVRRSSPIRP